MFTTEQLLNGVDFCIEYSGHMAKVSIFGEHGFLASTKVCNSDLQGLVDKLNFYGIFQVLRLM